LKSPGERVSDLTLPSPLTRLPKMPRQDVNKTMETQTRINNRLMLLIFSEAKMSNNFFFQKFN
jgi:hypothetical protein